MAASLRLEIYPSLSAMIERGVEGWRHWAYQAIAAQGTFSVALAGGSTPKQLYQALAQAPDLPWAQTRLFWGDERYVAEDHPDSNYRMVKEVLLDPLHLSPEMVFPWPTTSANPDQDALTFEQTLRQQFGGDWPQFDLMLLGMGEDGHTASLFPGTAALEETQRWTAVGNKDGDPRLTLTLPALNHSRTVLFWVAGSGKAERIRQVLIDRVEPSLPVQRVQPQGHLIWILDAAAAAHLPWPSHRHAI